jgi:hypothetical protein
MRNMTPPKEVIVGAPGLSDFLLKRFAERYKNPGELRPGVLFG